MMAEEIRPMEPAAIRVEIEKKRREMLDLRCQLSIGEEVHAHRLRAARKDIARMMTVLREKEGKQA